MPRYERYQEYVIRDGKLIGEFELMYLEHEDPWALTKLNDFNLNYAIATSVVRRLHGSRRVHRAVEIGCGLGHLTNRIQESGVEVLGIDISTTAIQRARERYPNCQFEAAAVGDPSLQTLIRTHKPDVVILADVTWYILDSLDDFLRFLRTELPSAYVLHTLALYAPGEQSYGKDRFTTLDQIKAYFGMTYLEWGESWNAENGLSGHSYFLAKWSQP